MSADLKTARDIDAADKEEFLRLICEGMSPDRAARELGSTGTAFRRLRNPLGVHYDERFAEAFNVAIHSDAHEQGRLERIRDMQWAKAEAGDTKMIEKLSLIYDPDWRELRHQNLNVNMSVIARALPGLSTEQLEQALAHVEEIEASGNGKLLEQGKVIPITEGEREAAPPHAG